MVGVIKTLLRGMAVYNQRGHLCLPDSMGNIDLHTQDNYYCLSGSEVRVCHLCQAVKGGGKNSLRRS